MGQQWTAAGAGSLGAVDLVMAQALLERSPLTHHRAGLGKQTLGGHKQNLLHTGNPEKEAVTPQEIDPDLPVSVQESLAEAWIGGGLPQGWGH